MQSIVSINMFNIMKCHQYSSYWKQALSLMHFKANQLLTDHIENKIVSHFAIQVAILICDGCFILMDPKSLVVWGLWGQI